MTTPPQLYRSVLRQFVQNSIHPRAERSKSVTSTLRQLFESARTIKVDSKEAVKFSRDVENMVVYMKSNRLHKALVERYNAADTLSGLERTAMSAKRVGLSMPEQFDPNTTPTMEAQQVKLNEENKRLKEGQGSLASMYGGERVD